MGRDELRNVVVDTSKGDKGHERRHPSVFHCLTSKTFIRYQNSFNEYCKHYRQTTEVIGMVALYRTTHMNGWLETVNIDKIRIVRSFGG